MKTKKWEDKRIKFLDKESCTQSNK